MSYFHIIALVHATQISAFHPTPVLLKPFSFQFIHKSLTNEFLPRKCAQSKAPAK
jgi:hypothetical protein